MNHRRGKKQKAVFVDRDGTIIIDKVYLNDPEQIEYIPGVFDSLKKLRDLGYHFFVATNQSGIPRGRVQLRNLNEIHRRIRAEFSRHGVDICEFYYAPYMTDFDHPMRKPNPGMLLTAAEEYNIDLGQSWMIGDKDVDVSAGHRAGARAVLVGDHQYAWSGRPPEIMLKTIAQAGEEIEKFMVNLGVTNRPGIQF